MRTETGGRIDRGRPLGFTFDGRRYTGYAGDTLASALLANGVHLVGRSAKLHRPRGILATGAEEPNALVTIERGARRVTPNTKATQVELCEGLRARSQNCWPSLGLDAGAALGALAPFMPAGGATKLVAAPGSVWQARYDALLRSFSGLGRAPSLADPDHYAQRYAHCDVLVIGAGSAGLSAALAAAESGARVLLAEEQAEMGGALLAETAVMQGKVAPAWLADTLAILSDRSNVGLLPRTTAFAIRGDNLVGLVERVTDHEPEPVPDRPRERLWWVRARQILLATGAIERPLVFPDNDRPGIMLADAARTYAVRYGVKAGARAVVLAACDSGYGAARDLEQAGIEIALIADLREQPGTIAAREGAAGIQIWQGVVPRGTDGGRRVKAVELVRPGRLRERANVPCDLVAMAGGWTPDTSLFAQAGGWLEYDAGLGAFVPAGALEHVRCAGACRGTLDLAAVLSEGAEAGHSAAMAALGRKTVASTAAPCPIEVSGAASLSGGLSGEVGHGRRPELVKSFVDFQNDITAADLRLAVQEGFRELEQVGVYTGGGSGTDGGRTAALHMSAIIAKATAKTLAELKPPAARWPVVPISIGALAGPSRGEPLDPRRAPPSHDWAVAHRAIVEDDGAWRRARAFPREGEDLRAAVVRECRLVRSKAGVLDLSALGKIEVSGPGAAPFLAYLLAGDSLKLAPGTCRYGLILCEDGTVLDHAIIACLGTGRYLITTTAGNDARVLDHLEGVRQRDRAQLDVHLTSVTEQWAAFAVQGPHARALLGPLVEGIDLSSRAMPHMSVREGRLLVAPLCLLRVSSTGEAGYEVFVPACFGGAAWEALAAEAEKVGGVPFGMEAMRVLRAEKGYCLLGNEIDGTVTPDDLGLGWMLANAKGDFIGKRSLSLPAMSRPGRRQLVGLRTESHAAILDIGSQITAHLAPPIGTHSLGHVTSAYWSETLGRSIALALVENGRARLGERLFATTADGTIPVTITSQVFYDPDARRIGG